MDRKITLCDVGIEGCQTDEEREEWCMRELDMTYAEYLEILNSRLTVAFGSLINCLVSVTLTSMPSLNSS